MGFFDTLFGSTEEYANPQRRMAQMMPGAMNAYFKNIQAQMEAAMGRYGQQKQRQYDLFRQKWDAQQKGFEEYAEFVRGRPSFTRGIEQQGREQLGQEFKKIEKGNLAASIQRGLGNTTVDLMRSTAAKAALAGTFEAQMAKLKSMEQAQRSSELGQLKMTESMLPVERIGARAALDREYAPYMFDPTSYMGFNLARIGMQPWGMMNQPIEDHQSGALGGALGGMAGQLGGAAIGALI